MSLFFCTLFDSNYLTRGLAMYESLAKHCEDFHLYIFPFDNKCLEILKKLKLDKVTIVPLENFENDDLLKIKKTRTKQEYCWTCTSSIILYVLEHFKVESCTYVDADIYFYSSPQILIDELQNKSVLITEHRYSKGCDLSETSGKYCVQFLTFKNNSLGLEVLKTWVNECIEWCYNRFEDGKFGDQKYLDDWNNIYDCVHELEYLGGGVAPWNVQQYKILKKNSEFFIKEKKSGILFKLIFYHFHGLTFYKNNIVKLANPEYLLSKEIVKFVYKPYIKKLENIKKNLLQIDCSIEQNNRLEIMDKKPLTFMYIFYEYLKEIVKAFLGINLNERIKLQKNLFKKKYR